MLQYLPNSPFKSKCIAKETKRKHLSICFITFSFYLLTIHMSFAQSYVEDAKNLVRLKEQFKNNITSQTFETYMNSNTFKKLVLSKIHSDGFTAGTSHASGEMDFFDGESPTPQDTAQVYAFSGVADTELSAEFDQYKEYIEFSSTYFDKDNKTLKQPLSHFRYLNATNQVLTLQTSFAQETSTTALGGLLGISELEVLQGITDWALNRAQEELMQAFLRDWLEQLKEDEVLSEAFPSTLHMLFNSELTSFITDGDTWKATFIQDLNAIPDRIPKLANLILTRLNVKIPAESKNELISGLTAISTLYTEIRKNKKPDDIILLMGEQAFNLKDDPIYNSTISKTLVGLNVFLTSIQSIENGEKKYMTPSALLSLNSEELKMLWKLMYTRQRDKFKFVFNLSTLDKEKKFFKHVEDNILSLKTQIAAVASTIQSIDNLITEAKKQDSKKLTIDQFNTYTLLVFDFVEEGLNTLKLLHKEANNSNKIEQYKQIYIEGFKFISSIQQGIKTKSYGEVALNTINIINWAQNYALKFDKSDEDTKVLIQGYLGKLNDLYQKDIEYQKAQDIVKNIRDILKEKVQKDYPDTFSLLDKKLDSLSSKIVKGFDFKPSNLGVLLAPVFNIAEDDIITIAKEISKQDLLNLQTRNEALNKFAKLMASVILAEDSEDIEEALNAVAMKTGGYLVKQQSHTSTSITFYPGIKYGKEEVEGGAESGDYNGSYFGASLPIGIEFAVGTNSKPIGAIGIFAQVLDLGAVINYSLNNESDDVVSNPEFGFKQVFSPGAYLTLHLTNNPITLGAGASYSPELRTISNVTSTINANALQLGFFLSVDLNVLTLHGSRKKYALKSKTRRIYHEE